MHEIVVDHVVPPGALGGWHAALPLRVFLVLGRLPLSRDVQDRVERLRESRKVHPDPLDLVRLQPVIRNHGHPDQLGERLLDLHEALSEPDAVYELAEVLDVRTVKPADDVLGLAPEAVSSS